jgi:hypothetical protein
VIIFTMNNAKNKHFSHERRMISRMNDNRDLHDVFSSRMRTRFDVFISDDWIRRFTIKENSKNQTNNSLERDIQ